jgi:hypothetical protein
MTNTWFLRPKQGSIVSDCLEKSDLVGYLIENGPEREMSQTQRWMDELMVESASVGAVYTKVEILHGTYNKNK